MKIKIVNNSQHDSPEYATSQSAGLDLRANLTESITLKPLARILIKTGLYIELPKGVEAQVRPRSGLAFKKGITVLNSPGTIDADYRGEIKVILINLGNEDFQVKRGDRIAQMILCPIAKVEFEEVENLPESVRGQGGFGSTGI